MQIKIRKISNFKIEKKDEEKSFFDYDTERQKKLVNSDRGFFVKSPHGFENSNGTSCNDFTVSLYNIPKTSILEIRFVSKINVSILIHFNFIDVIHLSLTYSNRRYFLSFMEQIFA